MSKHVKTIALTVMVVVVALVVWWSLGYRADNCHNDVDRDQQAICDFLDGN